MRKFAILAVALLCLSCSSVSGQPAPQFVDKNFAEYHFNGVIDGEKVFFYERKFGSDIFAYLEITKSNGLKTVYCIDDFNLEPNGSVKILNIQYFSPNGNIGLDLCKFPMTKHKQELYRGSVAVCDSYLQKIFDIRVHPYRDMASKQLEK